MNTKSVILLHQEINEFSSIDEKDVLIEVEFFKNTLNKLGFTCRTMPFSTNLEKFISDINKSKPDLVVNLVESFMGKGKLHFIAAAILENLQIPFTGNTSTTLFTTTNKLLSKQILESNGIITPAWASDNNFEKFIPNRKYIIKPIDEDASVGISQDSIVNLDSIDTLRKLLLEKQRKFGVTFFAEEYIDGREFNVSIIEGSESPRVLSPAEIDFTGFDSKSMYKIVDYSAKWEENSFQYQNTQRTFDLSAADVHLTEKIKSICSKCWNIFNLRGYARVDFRVDKDSTPYVIEVNANPCISPDGGFMAACIHDGLAELDIVRYITQELIQGG